MMLSGSTLVRPEWTRGGNVAKSLRGGQILEGSGRRTAQQRAVLTAVGSSGRFRTAQQIYSELRTQGARIGLTTVYRSLQRLADEGTIHSVQTMDRQTAYRLCSSKAHHHLVCTKCGAGIEIASSELDRWVEREATSRGYSRVTHSVEIFGLCSKCSASEQQPLL
jgi:Fur family transcriptional regulator, ferric uptake regulator